MRGKKKMNRSPRPSFYEDTQVLSMTAAPGPGNYNPRLSVEH